MENSQRGAQFVRGICREAVDLVERFFQPFNHAIQISGEPLKLIAHDEHVRGPIVVTDMRYFVGGESPPPSPPKGYLMNIKRWYVKLWARHDPAFQGRFLVESRVFGSGISAVAPYRTQGFKSPDWKGFQYDDGSTPHAVSGVPGKVAAVTYDFVKGGGGLDFPGLPDQVAGCLDGT